MENTGFIDHPDLPPREPPPTRKRDVFIKERYQFVDDYVQELFRRERFRVILESTPITLPEDLMYQPLPEVAMQITNNGVWQNDLASIRAIFIWVVTRNYFNIKNPKFQPKSPSPAMYFVMKAKYPHKVADLVKDLCRLAGIPCATIAGIVRGEQTDTEGAGVSEDYWNAVFVEKGWRLISPRLVTRVTGRAIEETDNWKLVEESEVTPNPGSHEVCEIDVIESHFLADPSDFIKNFYPEAEQWQLLDSVVSVDTFSNDVFVTEQFFDLEMSFLPDSNINSCITSQKGRSKIQFGLPAPKSDNYTFWYRLHASSETRVLFKSSQDRCVLYGQPSRKLNYLVRLPEIGRYKFEVYGGITSTRLCFSYIIDCGDPCDSLTLPDVPEIGWGPNTVSESFGLTPVDCDDLEVDCSSGQVSITLDLKKAIVLQQLLKHAHEEDVNLTNCSVLEVKGSKATIHARLPARGEYAIELFAHLLDGLEVKNVLNYLLHASCGTRPFPNVTNGTLGTNQVVNEMFRVKISSPYETDWIEVDDEKYELQLTTQTDDVCLFFELHCNNPQAANKSSCRVSRPDSHTWSVSLTLPVKAEYSFNVFARPDEATPALYGIHSFFITTLEKGRQSVTKVKEGEFVTKVTSFTRETTANKLRFPLEVCHDSIGLTCEPRPGRSNTDLTAMRFDHPSLIADVEKEGEYMVNVFTVNAADYMVHNISRYHIKKRNEVSQDDTETERKTCVIRVQNKHFLEQHKIAAKISTETVGEVSSYNMPPDGIFPILRSALLLLGYDTEDTRSWPRVQYMMSGKRKETIVQKLKVFNPYQVNELTYQKIYNILTQFLLSNVEVTSAGARIFFAWVTEVLKAVRGINKGLAGLRLETPRRPKTSRSITPGRNSRSSRPITARR